MELIAGVKLADSLVMGRYVEELEQVPISEQLAFAKSLGFGSCGVRLRKWCFLLGYYE